MTFNIFKTLRAIAIFEAAKGALVLAAGFGLMALAGSDLDAVAERVIEHMHLNPASRYPRVFIDLAARTTDARLWMLALGAVAYATVRFVEGYGLWAARRWAEWLAAASGAIYVPFEIYKIFHGSGWHATLALALNIAIVGVMLFALAKRKSVLR